MKTQISPPDFTSRPRHRVMLRFPMAWLSVLLVLASDLSGADTTISSLGKYTYTANAGWINFRHEKPTASSGVVFGDYFLSGYAYAANFGWIDLGDGSPSNGIRYQNNSSSDFGVNNDGIGNLSGYAYSANVGWINFGWSTITDSKRPRVDLTTGGFAGYAYGANIGWINLATGLITESMACVDSDGDSISDQWEQENFGNLTTADATSDVDGDSRTDVEEYAANTVPTDDSSFLSFTLISIDSSLEEVTYQITHGPGRFLEVETTTDLVLWESLADFAPTTVAGTISDNNAVTKSSSRFFRVAATKPLQP